MLGVLEARAMTGYELTQFFESSARWVWSAPQSQIYPALKRMETDGLIAGEEQVRGERLKRREYSITELGQAELREWLAQPQTDQSLRDPFLLQALFLDMLDPDDAEQVLVQEATQLRRKADQWARHRDKLLAGDTPLLRERLKHLPPSGHARTSRLKAGVFSHLTQSAEARLAWIEQTIAELRAP